MMRWRSSVLVILALLQGAPVAATSLPCATPADLLESGPLPQTASAAALGRLRILAVGSASVLGPGSSGPEAAWPARFAVMLRSALPGLEVAVEARGGRGLTARDQWAIIADALRGTPPDLVLWQAAATEAMRGLETAELADSLREGLERLAARGVDTVLIDLQFSRFVRAHADIEPYQDVLRVASAAFGAPLFRRYEAMQAWAQAGSVDIERTPRADRQRATDLLNACIAAALAAFVTDGIAEARR